MRIAIGILAIVVIAIGVLAAAIASRPSDFEIERSASIAAPPDVVFGYVNDFHRWEGWSPWAKLDPSMKVEYDGAPSGVGAGYGWTGDPRVGQGRMSITESTPSQHVAVDLLFLKPFAAHNTAVFTLVPDSAGTKVTWAMRGHRNFVGKAAGLFLNVDDLVGKQFEQGLASLRTLAEADAIQAAR
jgi:polyketide cyclase/dehydrase/lipid transport protein